MKVWCSGILFPVLCTKYYVANAFTVPHQRSSFSSQVTPSSSSSCRDERTRLPVLLDAATSSGGGHESSATSDNVLDMDMGMDTEDTTSTSTSSSSQYTSLQTGSSLTIKLGSPAASRKVWKKRRRSGSPVLIPCSVLGMDRADSIRWNAWYLLQKYGRTLEEKYGGGKGGTDGVALKVKNVVGLWEREFEGSLVDHAGALGYDGVGSLLLSLFDPDPSSTDTTPLLLQNHGVSILRTSSNLILHAPTLVSVRRARSGAADTALVRMDGELRHTGLVRGASDEDLPLSAALRLNNPNALLRVREGEVVSAFVFQYDATGDNGQPLLVLSLDTPPRSGGNVGAARKRSLDAQRERRRRKADMLSTEEEGGGEHPQLERMFEDLTVGDGPFRGKVLNINSRAQAAFVDMGVGRKRGKNSGGGVERILGMLRFDDIVVGTTEDEEEVIAETIEDVSDMFELDEDGVTLLSVDSETGEKTMVGSIDEDNEEEVEEDDSEDNLFAGMSADDRLMAIGDLLDAEDEETAISSSTPEVATLTTTTSTLNVGDDVEVYVRTVSPQSRRFMLTTVKPSPSTNYKDIKFKQVADKRLSKLSASLSAIEELRGTECFGVVKATSKTGNWCYVQPEVEASSVPKVGVAHPEVDGDVDDTIAEGDRVRIRLEGIDESRGQLSMTLLGKA